MQWQQTRNQASLASTSTSMLGVLPPTSARIAPPRGQHVANTERSFICALEPPYGNRSRAHCLTLATSALPTGRSLAPLVVNPRSKHHRCQNVSAQAAVTLFLAARALTSLHISRFSPVRQRYGLCRCAGNSDDKRPADKINSTSGSADVSADLSGSGSGSGAGSGSGSLANPRSNPTILQAALQIPKRWLLKRTPPWIARFIGSHDMKELMALVLPAFGAIFADPLMSLIDTAAVGQVGATQLAAMGPNTAIFNFMFQLYGFLSIGTTSQVASASASGDRRQLQRCVSTALTIAVVLGLFTAAFVQLCAPSLLYGMGASAELAAAGEPYLRVRGCAIPVVLVCMVSQGTFLGRQDARTPLLIFLAAGLVNVVLDLYLVLPVGANMGVTGAAIATLVSQLVAAGCFMIAMGREGLLESRFKFPTLQELYPFANSSGMLLLGSLCRMGVYTLMTITATRIGVFAVAAHQIGLQIFWFLTYFIDPLFVAATSFIARDVHSKPVNAMRMSLLLLTLACVVGCVLACLSTTVAVTGARVFTTDAIVLEALVRIAPLLGLAQLLSSVVFVAEGILIGAGECTYLAWIHCINFVVLGLYLAAVEYFGLGLQGIWLAIIMNQAFRLIQHFVRVGSGASPFPSHLLWRGARFRKR